MAARNQASSSRVPSRLPTAPSFSSQAPGDDNLAGQGDDDRLFGEQGDDILDGGQGGCCPEAPNTGDDLLYGGPGNDDLHTSDYPTNGNELHGEEGEDRLYVWSGGWAYGGNGNDEIYQYGGDAVLDGGNGDDRIVNWDDGGVSNETVEMIGGRGDDSLVSLDPLGTTHMDGGSGEDLCLDGDTTTDCEVMGA